MVLGDDKLNNIHVRKRDESLELWDVQKLKKTCTWATDDVEGIDPLELERSFHLSLKDGMTTVDVISELIDISLSKISLEEPNWSLVAGKLALMNLNKGVRHNVANFKSRNVHRKFGYSEFSNFLNWAEENNVYKQISKQYSPEEIKQIDGMVNPEIDLGFHYCTVSSMQKSYLQRKLGKIVELPQEMYMGIAMTLAPHVSVNNREKMDTVQSFYHDMSNMLISPATPVVHNMRTLDGSGMSCAVAAWGDNLHSIDQTISDIKAESSKGTGWGLYIGKVRSKGSWVKGHPNVAGGTIPMVVELNYAITSVDQVGARDSNIGVYQDIWHADLIDFLDLKLENGDAHQRAHDIFLGVCLNNEFLRRKRNKETWTLVDPYEAKKILGKDLCDFFGDEWVEAYKILEESDLNIRIEINAMDLWKRMLTVIGETGDPYMFNRDEVNSRNNNPNYPIYASNLCVTGDTRLHTQHGMMTAKELYDTQLPIIATVDNRTDGDWLNFGTRKENCITMQKTAKDADVYEVLTNSGMKIKATAWHDFYIREKDKTIKKVKLNELKEGDILLTQSSEGQWGNSCNYDDGLIMGFVAGDGTFGIKNCNGKSLCIDIYDKDIGTTMEDEIFKSVNKIKFVADSKKPSYTKGKEHTISSYKKDTVFFKRRINASTVGKYLKKTYNFNSLTKHKVPNEIFMGTKEAVVGYLRGLFTADGTVNVSAKNISIILALKQKDLVQDVQLLLSNFGIKSLISPLNRKTSFEYTNKSGNNKKYNSSPLWRLSITSYEAKKFMDEIGFLNEYKKTRFDEAWNLFIESLSGKTKVGDKNPNLVFSKSTIVVKSITHVGKEDVYDTTQHNNHSLIFNGIVTGNCTEITSPFSENKKTIKTLDGNGDIEVVTTELGYVTTCNLVSINLGRLDVNNPREIERVSRNAIRLVDAVISENNVASSAAKRFNRDFRSAGVGYIGYTHMLAKLGLRYGSPEAIEFTDKLLRKISYYVIDESMRLAANFGAFPKFPESNFAKGMFFGVKYENLAEELGEEFVGLADNVMTIGVRNGYMFAIAPNTSTSGLVNETPSIYPVTDKMILKDGYSGAYYVPMPELDKLNMWYKPAHGVSYQEYFDTIAVFQKRVDQGISCQPYFDPNTMDAYDLHMMYSYALEEKRLKTLYYVRQKPVSCIGCAN